MEFQSILAAEAVKSRGCFRWLHDRYRNRYVGADRDLFNSPAFRAWADAGVFSTKKLEFSNELLAAVERHAWLVGLLRFWPAIRVCWDELTPTALGALLAGLSERNGSGDPPLDWVKAQIGFAELSSESACQIACNAIQLSRQEILDAVFGFSIDWSSEIERFDIVDHLPWRGRLDVLSHRIIDLVLEAALHRTDEASISKAIAKGADPNIPIWVMQRSSEERHCALSLAISQKMSGTAKLLLVSGAKAEGCHFVTPNYPLYLALENGWDEFAVELLSNGASFIKKETGESGTPLFTTTEENQWIREVIGNIIQLSPVSVKQVFWIGHAQGWSETCLSVLVNDEARIRRFEALGLDTRLTAEELGRSLYFGKLEGLPYLLEKYGDEAKERVLSAIAERKHPSGT